MALFGRKKTTDASGDNNVPVDLQQYYSSGGSGVLRWILRVVLLLVIFALLVWGGIWLFRTLTKSDEPAKNPAQGNTSQQTQAQADAKKAQAEADAKKAQAAADAKKATDEATAKAKEAQDKAAAEAKKADEEAKKKAAAAAPAPAAPAPATVGGSGSGAETLPNAGPGEVAVAVFGAAAVLGTLGHMVFQRRQVR